MTERVRSAWAAWKRYPFARKLRLFGYAVLLIAAVELVVVSAVYNTLLPFWQSLLVNVGTDFFGVAITVLILNALQERAQEEQLKKQLIREMGSRIRDVAVPAAEELKARGWGFGKDTTLVGAFLMGADLQGANLMDAMLQDAILMDAMLQGANLKGADLQGANLGLADLQGADLFEAKLQDAFLADANLQGANLGLADLQGAILMGADLQGAILMEAKLQNADLRRAKLQGARLTNVKLRGANLKGAILSGAFYNSVTLWPDGFDSQAAGAINSDERAEPPANTKEL
jgi:uncharacterized protein YjbI with pentapeptide repeats